LLKFRLIQALPEALIGSLAIRRGRWGVRGCRRVGALGNSSGGQAEASSGQTQGHGMELCSYESCDHFHCFCCFFLFVVVWLKSQSNSPD
jgi:hypothetical protein